MTKLSVHRRTKPVLNRCATPVTNAKSDRRGGRQCFLPAS